MCSGVRRGGEANNAIRGLATVSQTHTAVFVFIYHSFTHRRQQGKKESEQNGEGRTQKEEKTQKKREMELKSCFKRWIRGHICKEKDNAESRKSEKNSKKYNEINKERNRSVIMEKKMQQRVEKTQCEYKRGNAAVFPTSLLAEASVTLSGLRDPHGNKNQHVCLKCFH